MMYASCIMKRTTIMLPDDLDRRVRAEARRRGTSVAHVVRESVAQRFAERQTERRLGFFAIGDGSEDGAHRVDDVVTDVVRRRHRRR